jgi:HPt (histidine-containing phosphotransfer) domain-containing protein
MPKDSQEIHSSDWIFDRQAALELVEGDEELLEDLARIFLRESPVMMQKLRDAVNRKDARAIAGEAHTLKGAVASLGSAGAIEMASDIERMGREENLNGLSEAFERLESTIGLLNPVLTRLAEDPLLREA